ncbi:MAG: hypothetical protein ACK596_11015, partial [Pseudanabaena sp.]
INNFKQKFTAPSFLEFFSFSLKKTKTGVGAHRAPTRFIAILNGLWKDIPSGCPSTNQKNPQMI